MSTNSVGTIVIDARIQSQDVKMGSRELASAVQSLHNTVRKTGKSLQSSATGYGAAMLKSVQASKEEAASLQEIGKQADTLKKQLDGLANTKIATDEYKKVARDIESATKRLDELKIKQQTMRSNGQNVSSAWAAFQIQIEKASNKLDEFDGKVHTLKARLQELKSNESEKEAISGGFYARYLREIKSTENALQEAIKNRNMAGKHMDALLEKQDNLEARGANKGSKEYINVTERIKQEEKALEDLKAKRDQLASEEGKGFVFGKDTTEYREKLAQYNTLEQKIRDIEELKNEAFKPPYMKSWENMVTLSGLINERFGRVQNTISGIGNAFMHPAQTLNRLFGAAIIGAEKAVGAFARTVGKAAASLAKLAGNAALSFLRKLASASVNAAVALAKLVTNAAVSALNRLSTAARNAASSLLRVTSKAVQAGFHGIVSAATRASKAVLGLNRNTRKSSDSFKRGLKTVIKYAFGVRSMYFLFRRVRTAIKEAFTEMAKYDPEVKAAIDGLKKSLNTLKGSLATAFAPILTAVAPMLTRLMNMLAAAMNTVGAFFAALMGKNTVARAIGNIGKSASDAGKKTKELKRQLMGFDTLTVLQDNDDDSGSDAEYTFKREKIASQIKQAADRLRQMWADGDYEGIGRLIGARINKMFQRLYRAVKWSSIKKRFGRAIKAVVGIFNGLVSEIDWKHIGKTISAGLNSIVRSVNELISGISFKNVGQAFAEALNGFFDNPELFSSIGTIIQTRLKAVLDFGKAFIEIIDETLIAKDIIAAITGIGWDGIAESAWSIVRTAFNKAGNLLNILLGGKARTLEVPLKPIIHGKHADEIEQVYEDKLAGPEITVDYTGVWDEVAENFSKAANEFVKRATATINRLSVTGVIGAILDWKNKIIKGISFDDLGGLVGTGFKKALSGVGVVVQDFGKMAPVYGRLLASFLNSLINTTFSGSPSLGQMFTTAVTGAFNFLTAFFSEFNAVEAANAIREEIEDVDWVSIFDSIWTAFETAATKLGQFLTTLFSGKSTPKLPDNYIMAMTQGVDEELGGDSIWKKAGTGFIEGFNSFVKKLTGFLDGESIEKVVGSFEGWLGRVGAEIDTDALGDLVGSGVRTALNVVGTVIREFRDNAPKYGRAISGFLNRVIRKAFSGSPSLGETFTNFVVGAFNFIAAFLQGFNAENATNDLIDAVNKIRWGDIAQAAFDALKAALETLGSVLSVLFGGDTNADYDDDVRDVDTAKREQNAMRFGNKSNRSYAINTAADIGKIISDVLVNGLGKIADIFTDLPWEDWGIKLGDVISNIDWTQAGQNLANALSALLNGLDDMFFAILYGEGYQENTVWRALHPEKAAKYDVEQETSNNPNVLKAIEASGLTAKEYLDLRKEVESARRGMFNPDSRAEASKKLEELEPKLKRIEDYIAAYDREDAIAYLREYRESGGDVSKISEILMKYGIKEDDIKNVMREAGYKIKGDLEQAIKDADVFAKTGYASPEEIAKAVETQHPGTYDKVLEHLKNVEDKIDDRQGNDEAVVSAAIEYARKKLFSVVGTLNDNVTELDVYRDLRDQGLDLDQLKRVAEALGTLPSYIDEHFGDEAWERFERNANPAPETYELNGTFYYAGNGKSVGEMFDEAAQEIRDAEAAFSEKIQSADVDYLEPILQEISENSDISDGVKLAIDMVVNGATPDEAAAATNLSEESIAQFAAILEQYQTEFGSLGIDTIDGYVNGLSDEMKAKKDDVKAALYSAYEYGQEVLETGSPSKLFERLGVDVVQGFVNGMQTINGALDGIWKSLPVWAKMMFENAGITLGIKSDSYGEVTDVTKKQIKETKRLIRAFKLSGKKSVDTTVDVDFSGSGLDLSGDTPTVKAAVKFVPEDQDEDEETEGGLLGWLQTLLDPGVSVETKVQMIRDGWTSFLGFLGIDTNQPLIKTLIQLVSKGWTTFLKFLGIDSEQPLIKTLIQLVSKGWNSLIEFVGADTPLGVFLTLLKDNWETLAGFIGTAITILATLLGVNKPGDVFGTILNILGKLFSNNESGSIGGLFGTVLEVLGKLFSNGESGSIGELFGTVLRVLGALTGQKTDGSGVFATLAALFGSWFKVKAGLTGQQTEGTGLFSSLSGVFGSWFKVKAGLNGQQTEGTGLFSTLGAVFGSWFDVKAKLDKDKADGSSDLIGVFGDLINAKATLSKKDENETTQGLFGVIEWIAKAGLKPTDDAKDKTTQGLFGTTTWTALAGLGYKSGEENKTTQGLFGDPEWDAKVGLAIKSSDEGKTTQGLFGTTTWTALSGLTYKEGIKYKSTKALFGATKWTAVAGLEKKDGLRYKTTKELFGYSFNAEAGLKKKESYKNKSTKSLFGVTEWIAAAGLKKKESQKRDTTKSLFGGDFDANASISLIKTWIAASGTSDATHALLRALNLEDGNGDPVSASAEVDVEKKGWTNPLSELGLIGLSTIVSVGLKLAGTAWDLIVKAIKELFGVGGNTVTSASKTTKMSRGGIIMNSGRSSWWNAVNKYAAGTSRAHGTVFVAGESGPEIMGHVNGRTEILNKSQLAEAIYGAVVSGMAQAVNALGGYIVSHMSVCTNAVIGTISAGIAMLENLSYHMPAMANGSLTPYEVSAQIARSTNELKSTLNDNNEDLIQAMVSAIGNAASMIVDAVQRQQSGISGNNMTSRQVLSDLNRLTNMYGASPLKGV